MKKFEHWVFINRVTEKIALYGSITAMYEDNDLNIRENKGTTVNMLRHALKDGKFENENYIIKKCELQRSKMINHKN